MRIVFVRHGEPDYRNDCLTETGKIQARQAAVRLREEGIEQIFSSPLGRAQETAAAARTTMERSNILRTFMVILCVQITNIVKKILFLCKFSKKR